MSCISPISVLSPESRWLKKCRKENRSYEYYIYQANQRRNHIFDPFPLVDSQTYYSNKIRVDYRYMSVPCGKCDGCLKDKVDSYFVRSYFEYLRTTLQKNGSVWFLTLTYSDTKLPRLSDGTPCFSRTDVQLFFKRLRRRSNLKFKDFYVSEFGSKTFRPHYHVLLFIEDFLPSDYNRFKLINLVAQSWTKIDDRDDSMTGMSYLGLFDMQRIDVRLVSSPALLRYTAKYVGKQFGHDDFEKKFSDVPSDNRRFHYASDGFGDCFLDFCSRDSIKDGYISIGNIKYKVPLYYRNKLYREYLCTFDNGSIVYRPTDLSILMQREFTLKQLQSCKEMAFLNPSFPSPPSFCYDPSFLEWVDNYFYNVLLDRDYFDSASKDFLITWNSYLSDVRLWQKNSDVSKIEKWKNQN